MATRTTAVRPARRTKVVTAVATAALACGGLGVLAGPATAATAPSTTPAPSAAAASCDRAPWQESVQEAPKNFAAGDRGGDYLWHDSNGFHLRVTHGGTTDQRVYSGEVTSNAPMKIDPVKLEKGDTVKLSADHKSFVFVFANHGRIDGVNFHTYCGSALEVSKLHVGSSDLPASHVYLGYYAQHPKAVPFRVHRYHG